MAEHALRPTHLLLLIVPLLVVFNGLTPYLDQLGFQTVGYGCTTCIGNSGPLDADIEGAITTMEQRLTGLIGLTPDERRELTKMGDKSEAFCRQAVVTHGHQVASPKPAPPRREPGA